MSQKQSGQGRQDQGQDVDWAVVLPRLRMALLALIGLGLVPMLVNAVTPSWVVRKARYWTTPRWWWPAIAGGVAVVAAAVIWEVLAAPSWAVARVEADDSVTGWLMHVLPVWGLNVALGVLLIPAGWAWKRHRVARAVNRRQIDDVELQEDIEKARRRAADLSAGVQVGVTIDPESGEVKPGKTTEDAVRGPHQLDNGRYAVGRIVRPTVRTVQDWSADRKRVRNWQEPGSPWLTVPAKAGQVRLLIIAESGQGKTVLLFELILALLLQDVRVVFIDGKGNPDDAAQLRNVAASLGKSGEAASRWNLFHGTAKEITDRIARLFPQTDGDGQFYRKRARTTMQRVQRDSPVTSLADLRARAKDPKKYVSDVGDRDWLRREEKSGAPRAVEAVEDIETEYEDLSEYISEDGWSFDKVTADLTTWTLATSDQGQKRLGDLLLLAYRQHVTRRADQRRAGEAVDERPMVVVIDEFAQLVGPDVDPAEFIASMQEIGRSLGFGTVAATQSVPGISNDEMMQRRLMSSGTGLIIGRSNDPEDAVKYAGTVIRMEASGAASRDQLGTGRAQHTFALHPQTVRDAADGMFWLVQNGAVVPFRALPPLADPTNANNAAATAETTPQEQTPALPAAVTPAPADDADVVLEYETVSVPTSPEGDGWEQAAPTAAPDVDGGVSLWERTAPPVDAAPEKSAKPARRTSGVRFRNNNNDE
ncbi:hypothetical protein NY551_19025 [Curtobacterium flaccumfaciens pv. oortii]|uniref:hypothetical protein n=1 Tax=Curtobacterium flaccumfaciens TaxID=2035 RepID=UPI0026589051|nr:hypothetical protein [Curtobacterium flaccumfaciens]MCS5524834.1 hypothetical protein [Curtobacterium flaccumfaciens pv. oortii]